jgi:branched-chain amino acid transport system substrate-binding protein
LASAQKKYDTGASDTEIKIGNIMPYTGPAPAYGVIGKAEAAYFKMINEQGGINGRKINFISYDDGYSPSKAVEQVRKLVETDNVLLVLSPFGTVANAAVRPYLNSNKVPHLFAGSGAAAWNDPKNFPWTVGWQFSYVAEGRIYAQYIIENKPTAKIAILYQNDVIGKDLLRGFKDELGGKASLIVAEVSQEFSQPLDEANIQKFDSLKADVLLNFLGAKHAVEVAAMAAKTGLKAQQIVSAASADAVGNVKNGSTIEFVTAQTFKTHDAQWQYDAGYKTWSAFMTKYLPGESQSDLNAVYGYSIAQALAHVLDKCGDNLTRDNVMAQATNLKGVQLGMMLPGVTLNTSKDDFSPIKQARMTRFAGTIREPFGRNFSGATCTLPKKQCPNDPNNCC